MSLRSFLPWAAGSLLVLAAGLAGGCGKNPSEAKARVAPNPSAPARYGPPTGVAAKEILRALPPVRDTNWSSAPFSILHTELSPALLVHSSTRYLGLFAELAAQGLGAPSHVAWSTKDGPRAFPPGETHDVRELEENWLLVWFAGAANWTNWDAPWAVFLQHRPTWLRLDERGLHLEFPASAGDVVVLPLYGYFKLPPAGRDYHAEHGLKSRELRSWLWEKALARDPLTRLRYWAGASREFPIYCEQTFSVDRARDELTVRSRIEWHSINDDWRTPHVKLAPVSPVLALAARDKDFPARFSKPFHDMEMPTPFGPCAGVPGADAFDVTFPWLHYVNETEVIDPPDTNAHPLAARALARYREATGAELRAESAPPGGDPARVGGNGLRSGAWPAPAGAWSAFGGAQEETAGARQETGGARDATGGGNRATGGGNQDSDRAQEAPACVWAPAVLAEARRAYRAGDLDGYNYACLGAVQALTRIWAAQRGKEFFRQQQPWHSLEWMDAEVFLTGLAPADGWRLDGPGFPRDAGARRFAGRWAGLMDADVARFARDWLGEEAGRELKWLHARPAGELSAAAQSARVTARGLLLNETPEQLGAVAAPEQLGGTPEQLAAACRAMVRAAGRPRYERLIPPGAPTPFVAGAERAARTPGPALGAAVASGGAAPGHARWPRLEWPQWPAPGGGPWSFGTIKPVRDGQPASVRRQSLNWNSEVVTYGLP